MSTLLPRYSQLALEINASSSQMAPTIARRAVYWTFDGKGFVDLVTALHLTRNDLDKVHVAPNFDHVLKNSCRGYDFN
jgi:hypothetical protein